MGRVLPVHATTVRLFLHVVAATVWVGGQVVLAALVPAVRRPVGAEVDAGGRAPLPDGRLAGIRRPGRDRHLELAGGRRG